MNKKTLFSGIQPTGEIHIGNYLGALKNWVNLQSQYNCIYSVVDLHAITIYYDPAKYQETILNTAMDLLAIGINPKKSILFVQSQVPQHTELCWLFNSLVPIAELERMTQFKDKAAEHKENINAGLFDYPVLQAADILLYKTAMVPVGQDQLQHLELTNTVVKKFNNKFGKYFEEIKPIINEGARIMSLTNPEKKMSKSLGPNNYIALNDAPEIIRKKIMSAVTDTGPAGAAMSAGVKNLFDLLKLFGATAAYEKLMSAYDNKTLKYAELKSELAETVIVQLKPIQEKRKKLENNKKQVIKILANGAVQAEKIAQKNMAEIKQKMGLL
ncbi:MAG: tryptophan--tRNA ligase [Candidatus Komeilibacteria bacterium]|nr:tryptophan--tRNA ligase [Candidatus Komeilibacteria bacterium]